jgi:hypothetical protein
MDFTFYVETRKSGAWNRPEEFAADEKTSRRLGAFTWIPGKSYVQYQLFFGDEALFRFRRERPPDTRDSALFQHLDHFYDYEEDERRLSWLPYEELLVDLWDEPSLLISARVPASQAALFGNGRQPFPETALATAGWDSYDVDRMREGCLVSEALDRTFGRGRNEVEGCSGDWLITVTWADSVSGYLGASRANAFRSLRQYGSDRDLRVISLYS